MSRVRAVALGVVAMLLAGLTACGIPDETDVRVDGKGPVADLPVDRPGAVPPPSRIASGFNQERFAINFLTAAAGEADEASERVNEYIVAGKQFRAEPGNEGDVNIVRLLGGRPLVTPNSDGTSSVRIDVQQVGVLRANGSVGEPVATESSYIFRIGKAPTDDPGPGDGLWVLEPPKVLLMTSEALGNYYQEHTIYFWNNKGDALVPDLRYLPLTMPMQRRATEVLDWLIGGPSAWLSSAAVRLPDGTGVVGNVPAPREGGRLEVNLSVKAGALETESDLKKIFTQIVWSLRINTLLGNELELKIQNQSRITAVVADYRADNPIYRVSGAAARFGVLAGSVYPLVDQSGTAAAPNPIPAEVNRDIVSAGMTRNGDRIAVALVARVGNALQLRVGSAPGVAGVYRTIGPYASIGRPVWLKGAGDGAPTGLVVADGMLREFSVDGSRSDGTRLIDVPLPGTPGQVSAVGASLDGHRIAFVAGGKLYVAAVRRVDGRLTIGPPRRLVTSLRDLSAVDWFGENSLVVAGLGENGRAAIYRLSIDGAGESPQVDDIGAAVVELSAYPELDQQAASFPVLYEANEVAYAAGVQILREEISPGSGAPPSGTAAPTAPFYLY